MKKMGRLKLGRHAGSSQIRITETGRKKSGIWKRAKQ
jgi:hypothetical protein